VFVANDTFISEPAGYGGPNANHGSDNRMILVRGGVGFSGFRTFPLLNFDLSSFAGQVVNGATGQLELELNGSNRINTLTVIVRESLVSWTEDAVTFANIGGTGFNEATQSGSNLSTTVITYDGSQQKVSFDLPSAVIQRWIDSPSSNLGVFLITPPSVGADDKVFSSREGDFSPRLTFEVSPVPETSTSLLLLAGLAGFLMRVRRLR